MSDKTAPDWIDMLLVHPAVSRDYIIEEETDWWVCKCGNQPNMEGFYTCNEIGEIVPPSINEGWDEKHYVCHRCWRIIDSDSLEIVGLCSQDVYNKNDEYRWDYY
jgi:DNA-directed RNA polymerase subunit RPC12/RpoP